MIYTFILLALFLVFPSMLHADIPQTITIHEGANTVTLSVVNNHDTDLSGVAIEFDRDAMPPWLSVRAAGQTLSIPRGMRSPEPFFLTFEVNGAPRGAEADVPFMLRDNIGNEWHYTIKVAIGSSNEPVLIDALYMNFPNPFNPSTTIRYSLKELKHVSLVVYNSLGQEVRKLVDTSQNTGIHTVVWDGKNDSGQKVSSGVYLYRLKAGSFVQTHRMMLVE